MGFRAGCISPISRRRVHLLQAFAIKRYYIIISNSVLLSLIFWLSLMAHARLAHGVMTMFKHARVDPNGVCKWVEISPKNEYTGI